MALKNPARHLGVMGMAFLLMAGCASHPSAPDPTQLLDLDGAVSVVADSLATQLQSEGGLDRLKAAIHKPGHHVVVVDPMIDGESGQHTMLSGDLERRVMTRIAVSHPELEVLPISASAIASADLLMSGTISIESADAGKGNAPGAPAQIWIALTNLKSGVVAAQAGIRTKTAGLDTTPKGFDQDSPVVLLDDVVKGYIRTAMTQSSQPADVVYLKHINASASIAEGTEAYNQAHYDESLQHFRTALADPSGEQLRALDGTYLSDAKLGKSDRAEQDFGRIVSLGISNRDLGVKFLFNPRTTDFWSDQKLTGFYDMWLRQIAKGINQSTVCVDVVGHASHTGTEAFNDQLSEQRAQRIRQRLLDDAPALGPRITAKGVGFRENIMGTGTDDARDAVDRRVGFRFRDCR